MIRVIGSGVQIEAPQNFKNNRYALISDKNKSDRLAIDYALPACLNALQIANKKADEIDLIISFGVSPSHLSDDPMIVGPRLGHPVQRYLQAVNATVYDLMDCDWGFAMDVAQNLCEEMGFTTVLIVRGESLSHSVYYRHPVDEFKIKDGAAALVLNYISNQNSSILYKDMNVGYQPASITPLDPDKRQDGCLAEFEFKTNSLFPRMLENTMLLLIKDLLLQNSIPIHSCIIEKWVSEFNPTVSFLPKGCQTIFGSEQYESGTGPFILPLILQEKLETHVTETFLAVTFDPFKLRICAQLVEI